MGKLDISCHADYSRRFRRFRFSSRTIWSESLTFLLMNITYVSIHVSEKYTQLLIIDIDWLYYHLKLFIIK